MWTTFILLGVLATATLAQDNCFGSQISGGVCTSTACGGVLNELSSVQTVRGDAIEYDPTANRIVVGGHYQTNDGSLYINGVDYDNTTGLPLASGGWTWFMSSWNSDGTLNWVDTFTSDRMASANTDDSLQDVYVDSTNGWVYGIGWVKGDIIDFNNVVTDPVGDNHRACINIWSFDGLRLLSWRQNSMQANETRGNTIVGSPSLERVLALYVPTTQQLDQALAGTLFDRGLSPRGDVTWAQLWDNTRTGASSYNRWAWRGAAFGGAPTTYLATFTYSGPNPSGNKDIDLLLFSVPSDSTSGFIDYSQATAEWRGECEGHTGENDEVAMALEDDGTLWVVWTCIGEASLPGLSVATGTARLFVTRVANSFTTPSIVTEILAEASDFVVNDLKLSGQSLFISGGVYGAWNNLRGASGSVSTGSNAFLATFNKTFQDWEFHVQAGPSSVLEGVAWNSASELFLLGEATGPTALSIPGFGSFPANSSALASTTPNTFLVKANLGGECPSSCCSDDVPASPSEPATMPSATPSLPAPSSSRVLSGPSPSAGEFTGPLSSFLEPGMCVPNVADDCCFASDCFWFETCIGVEGTQPGRCGFLPGESAPDLVPGEYYVRTESSCPTSSRDRFACEQDEDCWVMRQLVTGGDYYWDGNSGLDLLEEWNRVRQDYICVGCGYCDLWENQSSASSVVASVAAFLLQ